MVVVLCLVACAAAPSGDGGVEAKWPEKLSLLHWREAPRVADKVVGRVVPADARDEVVERAAREWLLAHYEGVQHVELQQTSLARWADTEAAIPNFCVVLTQAFAGATTDRESVIYLDETGINGHYLAVGAFEVAPGTECTAVPEAEVRRTIAGFLPALGFDAALAADIPLHLDYIWQGEEDGVVTLRPVWMLGEGPFLVDARTGTPGRNG
ncbi:MAG: hypothetical protein H6835_04465 [Planctomycetes bacterium]|nr:hypothetical protein [Planctomycetota bacterium]